MEDVPGLPGWTWSVGNCQCGAVGVPVATNEYYTNCAACIRKLAEFLESNRLVRWCTKCHKPAVFVAGDGTGLEWFECSNHDRFDNVAQVERTSILTIEIWRKLHGLDPSER